MNHTMSGKHTLIMLLCCLIPLAAFFLVSAFNIPLSSLGTVALVLLCPLMHILMMRGMAGHSHDSQGQPSCHTLEPKIESREPMAQLLESSAESRQGGPQSRAPSAESR